MKARIRKIMTIVTLLMCAAVGFVIGIFGSNTGTPIVFFALEFVIIYSIICIVNSILSEYLENKYSK